MNKPNPKTLEEQKRVRELRKRGWSERAIVGWLIGWRKVR